jgi:hypothetical protein
VKRQWTLFIAMIDAAACAAMRPSGLSAGVNAAVLARVTSSLRAASAAATKQPARCSVVRAVSRPALTG